MRERVALVLVAGLAVALAVALIQPHVIRVPDVDGSRLDRAQTSLRRAGLRVETTRRAHADYPVFGAEDVLKQLPGPGSLALKGSTVTLLVEGGEEPIEMPYLIGLYEVDARRKLDRLGLRHSLRSDSVSIVVSQEPTAGAILAFGSKVQARTLFPHSKQGTSVEAKRLHGIFYARYGVEGSFACNQCHDQSTCYGAGCHKEKPYADLQKGSAASP